LISEPQQVRRGVHVDSDFNWSGDDATSQFGLVEIVGEGTFGRVYRSLHLSSGSIFAVKIFKETSEESRQETKHEIEILRKCHHQNLVSYWGALVNGEDIWIIMDFCRAGSIDDVMNRCRDTLSEREVKYVVYNTLLGLSYLHRHNVIHRDIKAANVLLTEEGHVKIADFGVSKELGPEAKCNTLTGSPYWMAPEVLNMKGREYSFKADIWSLGITCIEMSTGAPPLYDSTPSQAMRRIPAYPPPKLPAREKGKEWGEDYNSFLAQCLAKDSADRSDSDTLLKHPFFEKVKMPKSLQDKINLSLVNSAKKAKSSEKKKMKKALEAPNSDSTSESNDSGTMVTDSSSDSGTVVTTSESKDGSVFTNSSSTIITHDSGRW